MRKIASKIRRRSSVSALLEKLENRQLFASLTVGPTAAFHTIQSAINAAHPGDNIMVNAGTYVEQLVIPASLTNLTIQAQNTQNSPNVNPPANSSIASLVAMNPDKTNSSYIVAPASMTGNKAIIDDSASGFRLNGFVVEGPSTGINYGVLIEGGTTGVQIHQDHILHIRDSATPSNTAHAVYVTGGSSATLQQNFISDYQKDGVFITGAGSVGTLQQNVVLGVGPNPNIVQVGIVYDGGGSGAANQNLVVGNISNVAGFGADGILLFNSGQVSVNQNIVYNNDEDIVLDGPSTAPGAVGFSDYAHGSKITQNETYGATFDGIALFDGVNSATISQNNSHNNGFDGLYIADDAAFGGPEDGSYGNLITNDNKFAQNGFYDVEDDTLYVSPKPVNGNFGTGNFYKGSFSKFVTNF